MDTPTHTPAERAAISAHEQLHATLQEWFTTREELFALETRLGELGDRIDELENSLEAPAPTDINAALDQMQANLAEARNAGDWSAAQFIELDLAAFCEKHGINLNDEAEDDDEEEEAPAPAPAPLKFSIPPRLYGGRLDDPGIGEFTMSDGYSDQVVGFIGTYQAALAAHPGYYPYLRQIPTE